jgi:hypothetical protein
LLADAPDSVARDPKQKSTWAKIKQHEKQLQAQLRKAEEEKKALQEYRERADKAAEEAVAYQKRLEEAENRIARLDLTQSSEFQGRYDNPIKALYSKSMRLLKTAVETPDEAQALLGKVFNPAITPQQLQESVQDLPLPIQGVLIQNSVDLQELVATRNAAIDDWKNTRKLVNATGGQRSVIEQAKEVHEAVSKAVPELVSEGSWFFTEDPDNADWNNNRNDTIASAKVVLKEGRPEEVAKLVLKGMAADMYQKWGESEHHRAQKLEAELKRRFGAAPGLGGGRNVPAAGAQQESARPKGAVNATSWLDEQLGTPR